MSDTVVVIEIVVIIAAVEIVNVTVLAIVTITGSNYEDRNCNYGSSGKDSNMCKCISI